jgi:two-component system nitrate/nitrite response regulator NarL
MRTTPIRVMLVDDHKSLLWGLSKLIEGAAPDFELAGTASNPDEALETARRTEPDVVLLDLDLDGHSSFDMLPDLLAQRGLKALILSGHRDPLLRQQAMMLGASGFIGKDQPAQTILPAIERVQAGELWIDRASMGQVLSALTRAEPRRDPEADRIASLSQKERTIIATLARSEGKPNKVLADQLGMAEHTLRNHLSAIYAKLGVRSRLALYMYALRNNLASTH